MALHVGKSLSILFKTMPYIILRLFVYLLFACLFLFYLGILYLLGQALAGLHEYARMVVWFLGLIVSFPLVKLAREYLLYLVKAGHVAVIAELITKGTLPEGRGQIEWGRTQVTERFKTASVLFVMDRLVNGVIASVNRMMWRVGGIFSAIPGIAALIKLANFVLYFGLTYIDESVLARNFIKKDENIWQSAKSGIVLYVQAWKEMLKASLMVSIVAMLAIPLLIVILLVPALGLAAALPAMKVPFVLCAIVFAFALKGALLDPWTLIMTITNYLETTKGMVPDPEWEAKLEGVSKKFKKLKENVVKNI